MKSRVVIAANWKMNLTPKEATQLAKDIVKSKNSFSELDIVLLPSFLYVTEIATILKSTSIGLGGQDICFEEKGAFTGEVAAFQLKEAGCTHCLIGHSERRHYYHEDYDTINKKVLMGLNFGLKIILCVGESLEEKEQGLTEMVVIDQIVSAFQNVNIKACHKIIVAYEPIWAIGTGKTATPCDAAHVHSIIRKTIESFFSKEVSENLRILYGGSVKPENIASLLEESEINGALVGGASLKSESFFSLIQNSLRS